MSLDPRGAHGEAPDGEEVEFGKALLATGANVNILRVEGAELEGIHYLRAFGNSDAIREEAEAAEHVVLIGGSYIGCEVAASLTAKGTKCTIVMMEDVALSRTFGEEAGRWFQERARGEGHRVRRRRRARACSRATGGSRPSSPRAGRRSRATWSSSARGCGRT